MRFCLYLAGLLLLPGALLAADGSAVAEDAGPTNIKMGKGEQAPPSLFFTPAEAASLEAIIFSRKDAGVKAVPPPEPLPNVYLSALVYHSENDWTAWINGLRFRPGTVQMGIRPLEATSRWVLLDIDTVKGPTIQVRLAPNQTYLSKSDHVVDGIYP